MTRRNRYTQVNWTADTSLGPEGLMVRVSGVWPCKWQPRTAERRRSAKTNIVAIQHAMEPADLHLHRYRIPSYHYTRYIGETLLNI